MRNLNPALFYFWAHDGTGDYDPMEELDTPVFHELLGRADRVFLEFISSRLEGAQELQDDLNEYIRTGELPEKLRKTRDYQIEEYGTTSPELFIAELIKRSQRRIILEKTIGIGFDYNAEDTQVTNLFFRCSLELAVEARRRFLEVSQDYQANRERDVARQINEVPETTLVLFGAGHFELETRVANERVTEVYFPYAGYPQSFETLLNQEYRRTREVNRELFLRSLAEQIARKAITATFASGASSKEVDGLANHYATILAAEQIVGLKDYLVFCRRIQPDLSQGEVFVSFLQREGLPGSGEGMDNYRRDCQLAP